MEFENVSPWSLKSYQIQEGVEVQEVCGIWWNLEGKSWL